MTRVLLDRVVTGLLALLAALPAGAQQYSYSRDLDVVRRVSDNKPLQNVYWVSLPLVPDIADVADTGSPLTNKCVGDIDGPPAGDGILNADDLVCAWWTARSDRATAGTFTLSRSVPNRCTFDFRTATVSLGTVRFLGKPFDLEQGIGYQVRVSVAPDSTASPRSRALITGDHDPSFGGRPVVAMPTCLPGQVMDCCASTAARWDLCSVPYNTTYATADEILCGLEGVDWQDADGNGNPDVCWDDANGNEMADPGERRTGIFDGNSLIVAYLSDNTEAVNAPVGRAIGVLTARLRSTGTNFALVPGDAYRLSIPKLHSPTVLDPPVP